MKRKRLRGEGARGACYEHAALRAQERYGLALTRDRWDWLGALLLGGRGRRLNEEHGGTQVTYEVTFLGRRLYVVYDTERACVTTLLPPEDFA